MPVDTAAFVLWQLALVALLALSLFWRDAPATYWAVALGLSVSWFADLFASVLCGSFIVTHYYPVLQLGFFAFAFGAHIVPVMLIVVAMVVPITGGPEMVVTAFGSVLVLTYATLSPTRLSAAMWAYCGVGTVFYLLLATEVANVERFMVYWWIYQACRLSAFALFIRAAYGDKHIGRRARPGGVDDRPGLWGVCRHPSGHG